jgi:hypothetical protein
MKRWLITLSLVILAFVAGFQLASHFLLVSSNRSEKQFKESLKDIQQRVYGDNCFHLEGIDPESDVRLNAFDPAKGGGTIRLAYSSVWNNDCSLTLNGDGTLTSENKSGSRVVTTLDHDRCKAFFRKTLASGLLNYSQQTVDLKKDLDRPNSISHVNDAADVEIIISVPELGVNKTVSIYAPDTELKNFPDIIELQILTRLEREILELVPKGDPDWSRFQ